MTISIALSPQTEAILRVQAQAAGEDISSFAARVLDEALATRNVDELLAPFRRQVTDSGMTDEALDEFYEGLRNNVWQEPQPKRARPA